MEPGQVPRRRLAGRVAAALGVVGALVVLSVQAAPGSSDPARGAAPAPKIPRNIPIEGSGSVIPDSYLVSLARGEPAAVAAEHAALGARIDRVFSLALRGYTARMTAGVARRVAGDPRVRAVTLDRRISAAAQKTPPGVARVGAPLSDARVGDGTGDVDADIAVLDTGIDVDHPDLNVVGGVDCVGSAGSGGYDDARGHGTHIAGIAAARDNGVGVAGVAPGARLWAVRVLDARGNGSLGTLVCGIEWVTAQADVIEVANMSLSGLDPDLGCQDGALHEAICGSVAAGVTYTVAAGNTGRDADAYSPATYPEVITVSALADFDGRPGGLAANPQPTACPGADDQFAPFSNHGSDVDLVAPGVCITSTWIRGGYAELTGTSQSAAHVAGAAALYLVAHPQATPAQVRAALVSAGSADWARETDPDGNPDPLLAVQNF